MKKEIYIDCGNEELRKEIGWSICEQLQGNPDFVSCAIGCNYTDEDLPNTVLIWVDDDATTSPKIEIQL